jgi:hypothetical protein
VQGICEHLAKIVKEMHGLDIDPLTDVAICCGQTESFAAAIFASMLYCSCSSSRASFLIINQFIIYYCVAMSHRYSHPDTEHNTDITNT